MNILEGKNFYEILEVQPEASLQEINEAYIRVKGAYSKDSVALYSLFSESQCEQMIEQIEEAYSILSIPDKRNQYNEARGIQISPSTQGLRDTTFQHQTNQNEFVHNSEYTAKSDVNVSRVTAFNKFKLDYEVNHEFEQEIDISTHFDGAFLQRIREYKNVTIERMAEMTKISKTYIKNLEENNYSHLPAEAYTRGFVYQYAKCLKLNTDLVTTSYMSIYRQVKNQE